MKQEKIRQKKLKKKIKREKRKLTPKEKEQKQFEKKKKIWLAGSEMREYRNKWHIHKWSKMARKKPNGEYETVGYICNRCGIRKKSWLFEIKKLFR
jgi:TPP-dependent indolepyruvate ferredoxin oxidoreductase alpha subunit